MVGGRGGGGGAAHGAHPALRRGVEEVLLADGAVLVHGALRPTGMHGLQEAEENICG